MRCLFEHTWLHLQEEVDAEALPTHSADGGHQQLHAETLYIHLQRTADLHIEVLGEALFDGDLGALRIVPKTARNHLIIRRQIGSKGQALLTCQHPQLTVHTCVTFAFRCNVGHGASIDLGQACRDNGSCAHMLGTQLLQGGHQVRALIRLHID